MGNEPLDRAPRHFPSLAATWGESADLGHKVRAFDCTEMKNAAQKKFIAPHPIAEALASHDQRR